MSSERLQRILARSGWGSRRAAEDAIRQGRVTINGQIAVVGASADPASDSIKVDGRRVRLPKSQSYVLLNKPVGCVSTRSDPQGRPTVLDLLPARLRRAVVPVGRLDFNSEGLILLTDDGDLAQRLAHPRYGCSKTYRVKVSGRPSEDEVERLRRGVVLDGRRTRPCVIRFLRATGRGPDSNSWWEVVLSEGRTRQIRDMFFRIRHSVLKLQRVAIGSLRDQKLPRGAWRTLSAVEVEELRNSPPAALPEGLGAQLPERRDRSPKAAKGRPKEKPARPRPAGKPKPGGRRSRAAGERPANARPGGGSGPTRPAGSPGGSRSGSGGRKGKRRNSGGRGGS